MRQKMKNLLSMLLVICFLTMTLSPTNVYGNEIMPLYDNTQNATVDTYIDKTNGILSINYHYTGYSNITTKAVITTYIEKQFLGIFWTRVDIGTTNDEWVQTVNNYRYSGKRTFSLLSEGTYRTTVIYEIYGSEGSVDKITCQDSVTY